MEKIIERIRKLMALAGNNPNEAERDAAMRKAHQLLIEHNLTPTDVIDNPETVAAHSNGTAYRNLPWRRVILTAIAKLYFCKLVTHKGADKKVRASFIGMRVDAEVAQVVADALINSINAEAHLFARTNGGSDVSFKNGAASTIYRRCEDLIKNAQSEKVPGTALVVQSLYQTRAKEAEAFINQTWGELKKAGRGMSTKFDEAAIAGRRYGESVSLHKTVK